MTVKVKVSSDRKTETEKELVACAGFDPRREDGYLIWQFHSREVGDLFLVNARNASGVVRAEIGG
jgi:hypothetical protein